MRASGCVSGVVGVVGVDWTVGAAGRWGNRRALSESCHTPPGTPLVPKFDAEPDSSARITSSMRPLSSRLSSARWRRTNSQGTQTPRRTTVFSAVGAALALASARKSARSRCERARCREGEREKISSGGVKVHNDNGGRCGCEEDGGAVYRDAGDS